MVDPIGRPGPIEPENVEGSAPVSQPSEILASLMERFSPEEISLEALPFNQELDVHLLARAGEIEREIGEEIKLLEGSAPQGAPPRLNDIDAKKIALAFALLQRAQEEGKKIIDLLDDVQAEEKVTDLLENKLERLLVIENFTEFLELNISLEYKIPKTLGKGASLILRRAILNKIHAELIEMKREKKDPQEIARLEVFLAQEEEKIRHDSTDFGVKSVALLPHIVKKGLELGNKMSPGAGLGLAAATLLVEVGTKGYELHESIDQAQEHAGWVNSLKKNQPDKKEALKLYENRRAAYALVTKSASPPIKDSPLSEILGMTTDKIIEHERKKSGEALPSKPLEISEIVKLSPEKILAHAKQQKITEEARNEYQNKQAKIVMAKNSLQALSLAKVESERKFFGFNVSKAAIGFTTSVLAAAAIITLKALVIGGVLAISGAAFAYGGIGIFALGLALLAAGLIFLYIYKPHLFKSMFSGVQTKLAFYEIPESIAKFRAQKKEVELALVQLEMESIRTKFNEFTLMRRKSELKVKDLPLPLQPIARQLKLKNDQLLSEIDTVALEQQKTDILNEWKKKEERIQGKLHKLEEKVAGWEKKTVALQKQVFEANWKDLPGKIGELDFDQLVNTTIEGLTADPDKLDPGLRDILSKQIGMDFGKIGPDPTKQKLEEEVRKALTNFISLSDKSLIEFIKNQKRRLAKIEEGVAIT